MKKNNSIRISNKDGTRINYKRILSWFYPRYDLILNHCKDLPNHHVHDGKSCVRNRVGMVTTRDGLGETDLASYCRSIPNHFLPRFGHKCRHCPNGVKKYHLACNEI